MPRLVSGTWRSPVIVFADGSTDPAPAERRDRLTELPPSAKLVFKVLEYDSPLTQTALCDRTRLSKRTTRHALSLLKEADLVEEEIYIPDARKRIYTPHPVGEPAEESVS